MSTKIPISLIIVSIVAILMDCYTGYAFFLMTVMSLGPDSPILYLSVCILILILFISSIIGVFKLKKWALNIFVTLTLVVNSLLLLIYILFSKPLYDFGNPTCVSGNFYFNFHYLFSKTIYKKIIWKEEKYGVVDQEDQSTILRKSNKSHRVGGEEGGEVRF